jgi:hypothetical protein
MKKDDVLKRREQALVTLNSRLSTLSLPQLIDDGKLYHEEIEGENRWAQRLSAPGWPHVSASQNTVSTPGLRYEIWYFQKRSELWLGLLHTASPATTALSAQLKPQWKDWLESGRYARRYRALTATWQKSCPGSEGIWRELAGEKKLDEALELLVRDTLPVLEKLLAELDPTRTLELAQLEHARARNPLEELASRFNAGRR